MAAEKYEPSEVILPQELGARHLALVPSVGEKALAAADLDQPPVQPATSYIDRFKPASPIR